MPSAHLLAGEYAVVQYLIDGEIVAHELNRLELLRHVEPDSMADGFSYARRRSQNKSNH